METQHRAVLQTVTRLVDPEEIARRDRAELVDACRTLADWLRQYVQIAAEQSAEINRLSRAYKAALDLSVRDESKAGGESKDGGTVGRPD